MTLASILIPIAFGMIIAACLVFINKQTLGKFVKRLFYENADSEQSARTLTELGFEKNRLLRRSLRDGSSLRKVVHVCDGAQEGKQGEKKPLRYYIPEDCAYRAEVLYNPDGSSVLTILITVIMFVAIVLLLMMIVPDLIQMVANAVNRFKTL